MTRGLERLHRILDGQQVSGFLDALGPRLTRAVVGEVELELAVPAFSRASTSPSVSGLVCAVADIAATCAVTTIFDSPSAAVTQALWIHFLRAPRGTPLRAHAAVDDHNEVALLTDGRVEESDGAVVARFGARCLGVPAITTTPSPTRREKRQAELTELPIELQLEQQHTIGWLSCTSNLANAQQVMHGGAILVVAEAVGRTLLVDQSTWLLADVEASFARGLPADGSRVDCVARVRHAGRTSTTVSWSIGNAAGKTAAYGSFSWLRATGSERPLTS